MKTRPMTAFAVVCNFLSACALQSEPYPTMNGTEQQILLYTSCAAAPTSYRGATEEATATATENPPTVTPTDTLTPTPFIPFQAVSTADGLNLRTGPGYLFTALGRLSQGSNMTVRGKSRGGEWFYVSTPDHSTGWVYGQLLKAAHDLQEAPVIEPEDVLLIRGMVRDGRGTPIQGVVFNVLRTYQQNTPSNTVVSDINGEIFSFMPADSPATWVVAYAGIACISNVWKSPGCTEYKEGYTGQVEPLYIEVSLPFDGMVEFTWK